MPAAAREYLSSQGIGDLQTCELLLAEIASEVRGTFASQSDNRRANFQARILEDARESGEEGITQDEVELHCHGVYPFLWVNFTYDPTRVQTYEIQAFEERFALMLIGTAESHSDFY